MFSLTARTSLKAAAARSLARPAPIAVRFIGGHGSTMHDNDPEVRRAPRVRRIPLTPPVHRRSSAKSRRT
jgi:hypothetical protein